MTRWRVARVALLLALLAPLLVLQVRWLDELQEARLVEQQRLLQGGVDRLALDLDALVDRIAGSVAFGGSGWLRPEDAALVAEVVPTDRDALGPDDGAGGVRVLPGPAIWVPGMQPGRGALVRLDLAVLSERVLPRLALAAFGEANLLGSYRVTVEAVEGDAPVLYESSPPITGDGTLDASAPTFRPSATGLAFFSEEGATWKAAGDVFVVDEASLGGGDAPEAPAPVTHVVTAQHRDGSLHAAVARQRTRELWLGGGVLALLGAGVVTVWRAEQRARRLAETQLAFVAGVSHELRTPLAAMRIAASNLEHGVVRDVEQAAGYGALLEGQVARMSGLVERVLRFASDQEATTREPVDVAELVARAAEAARQWEDRRRFRLEFDVAPDVATILGDGPALLSALQNLVDNALKFGPDDQRVVLRAERTDVGVRIAVEDGGPGIEPGERARVLAPFKRGRGAREPGSGLGLSVVDTVVRAHGGRLVLTGSPAGGLTAIIELPAT